MSVKASWYTVEKWEFIYQTEKPALNPNSTINYNPNAHMYHEDLTFEEYFNKYSPDTPPEVVQILKEETRENETIESAKKAAHHKNFN